jgi:hypothetical protein
MTDIINFDIKQLIESSVSEFNKNLTTNLEVKIREDIIKNILETKSRDSIFGLDNIADFGKLDPKLIVSGLTTIDNYPSNYTSYDRSMIYNISFQKDEYPILVLTTGGGGYSPFSFHYTTNRILNKILSNDEILLLILLAIKMQTNIYNDNFWRDFPMIQEPLKLYLVENNLMNENYGSEFRTNNKLDKSIKKYFDAITDYKIKAIEYDKIKDKQFDEKRLKEENKELKEEIYNIQTENIRLKEKNNIQKIIIKDFESRVQTIKNQLLLKNKYEQLIKDLYYIHMFFVLFNLIFYYIC